MKKIAGAMALGVVLAAGSITAAEAAPKSFTVTAKVSRTKADVGAKVKVSGKVSGQSAKSLKGKKVTVQRKYVGGGWKKIGTAKISSKRTFALSTKLVKGGNTSFRVVKGKSGKIKSGTSAARTLPVYKWIDLTTAPHFAYSAGARNVSVTMAGKVYPRALQSLDGMMVMFKPAKACTTFTTVTGFRDKDKAGADPTTKQHLEIMSLTSATPGPMTPVEFETTLNQVVKRSVSITGKDYVQAAVQVSPDSAAAVLASPQVRCNLDNLPAFDIEDLMPPAP